MSALQRAIAAAVPVQGLAPTSPLGGLRRRRVGGIDVAAQSVAAVAPAGVALTNPGPLGEVAGPSTILAVLTTVVVVLLLGLTVSVFARRITSTGSLYTFTSRGLGRVVGVIGGAALALGYAGVAMGTLYDAARRAVLFASSGGSSLPENGVAPASPGTGWIALCLIGFAGLIAFALIAGVRMSTRVMLVVEIGGVLTVAVVALVVFQAAGWDLSALRPSVEDFDADAVLSGVAIGLIAFVGFESGAALGPETKRPLAAVPRALLWTVLAVSLSYLLGVSAHTVGTATTGTGAPAGVPLAGYGERAGLAGIAPVIDLIIVLSYAACALATSTALVRLLFVMGREGLVPAVFGRVSVRGTPAHGGAIVIGVVAGVPLVALALGWAQQATDAADKVGIIGYLLAYVLVAVAAPVFLVRLGEFQWRHALPAGLVALVLGGTLVHYLVVVPPSRLTSTLIAIVVLVLLTVLFLHRARRPGVAARIGLFDSPTAADSIGGSRSPGTEVDRRG